MCSASNVGCELYQVFDLTPQKNSGVGRLHCPGFTEGLTRELVHHCKGLLTRYHKLGSSSNRNVCLTALEARRPRSRCQQSWYFLRVERKSLFPISALASGGLLAICHVPRTIKASPPSLPVSSRGILPVCFLFSVSQYDSTRNVFKSFCKERRPS